MKNFTTAKALALSLLCATAALAAKSYDSHEYRDEECCGTPLYCGSFNLEVHGGIAPTLWNKRDCFLFANSYTNTTVCPNVQLSALGSLPKFSSIYRLPWDVGFRLGYGVTEKIEVTFEFDYRQASAKNSNNSNSSCCTVSTSTLTVPANQLTLCYTTSLTPAGASNVFTFNCLTKYKAYVGHVGARWYSERYFCDAVSFFLGIKVGFVHHKAIYANINSYYVSVSGASAEGSPFPFNAADLFYNNTTISAGGLVGFDWCFWNRLSFVVQVDFLGQGPLRGNHNLGGTNSECNTTSNCSTGCVATSPTCVALATNGGGVATGLVGPNFNTEVVFPVTFGLKYYF